MRPRGHVLQVSQGKGLTLAAAQWSALSEAIELAAAENPDVSSFSFGPGPEGSPWDVDGLCVAWVPGVRLNDRKPCVVPAQSVYCPARCDVLDGPSITTCRSNGLGAHPTSRAAAEEHAVLELVERDGLARVLPEGWTPHEALRRLVKALGGLGRLGTPARSKRRQRDERRTCELRSAVGLPSSQERLLLFFEPLHALAVGACLGRAPDGARDAEHQRESSRNETNDQNKDPGKAAQRDSNHEADQRQRGRAAEPYSHQHHTARGPGSADE